MESATQLFAERSHLGLGLDPGQGSAKLRCPAAEVGDKLSPCPAKALMPRLRRCAVLTLLGIHRGHCAH
ncbi:Hypothetical protein CAP_5393 [Chondromyces apiculatus DSM 436]|uniref:Uncharacterized protein n=1 Tax=Chondromyces apiculatus DSM 436 TaxID=1192034 RepID=A0A017T3Q6_9BACT|nr:Hypothetical protein CAP_5393 [Chondromyces apiculatus DSM 436]